MPWEESVLIMDVMDEVRKQGEVKYPEEVESFWEATAASVDLRWGDI